MNFDHDYYEAPKEGKRLPTVLCMCCEKAVRSSTLSSDEMRLLYKEKPIKWQFDDGTVVNGVVILCPVCVDKKIDETNYPKILNQINKAFAAEAKWAKADPDTSLAGATLIGEA